MKCPNLFSSSFFIISLLSIFVFPLTAQAQPSISFYESPYEPWGTDVFLCKSTLIKSPTSSTIGQKGCEALIRFFQVYISIIDGPRSSYYPTSSQYALDAIRKYGVLKGIALGCDRLIRENEDPWIYPITCRYGVPRKLDLVR